MKFRLFVLKEDITQLEYVHFRTELEKSRPAVWSSIEKLPVEIFYDVLTRSAIKAGWVQDVVEDNEYDEEVIWEWTEEYLDGLPADEAREHVEEWGDIAFKRWVEIKTLDPN